MFGAHRTRVLLLASLMGALCAPLATAAAQETDHPRVPHHRLTRGGSVQARQVAAMSPPASERRLTIQRRPQGVPPAFESDDDIYLDGNVGYNSVRTFSPAPYADSGREYPFGLDGIGGYGSDLGFGAGHDDALYDRGP